MLIFPLKGFLYRTICLLTFWAHKQGGIWKFPNLHAKEKNACTPEVCTYAFPRHLRGRLPPEFYFEAALKIWPVAQAVFKFCQNFTSLADIVGELGTLRKRHYLLQFGDSAIGMTLWWLGGHKMDRAGD